MSTPESLLMYDLEPWTKGILKPFYLEIISNIHKSCKKVKLLSFLSLTCCQLVFACVLCVFVYFPSQTVGEHISCFLTPIYFSVWILRIRTFSHITTVVQLPLSGDLTLIWCVNILFFFPFHQNFFSSTESSLDSQTGSNPHCRQILFCLSHQGSPRYVCLDPFNPEQFLSFSFFHVIDVLEEYPFPSLCTWGFKIQVNCP